MAKITKEELKRRKAELGKQARQELAKTEIMRFRLDPSSILKLYELAEQKRQHVGAMVRQWVLERVESETKPLYQISTATNTKKGSPNMAHKAYKVSETINYDNDLLTTIVHRLEFLETKVKHLSKRT